jgi:hypothetical protein
MARPSLGRTVGSWAMAKASRRGAPVLLNGRGSHRRSRRTRRQPRRHPPTCLPADPRRHLLQAVRRLAVCGPAGADHSRSYVACQLHGDRTDTTSSAVSQRRLVWCEARVVDESLPRRQSRDRQSSGHGVLDVSRQGSELPGLKRHIRPESRRGPNRSFRTPAGQL